MKSFWQDYLSIQFDPAHLLSELGFTLVFDLLGWLFVKKLVSKLLWKWHLEIDKEHGVDHT